MSSTPDEHAVTDADVAALEAHLERERAHGGSNGQPTVTREECARIHELSADGWGRTTLAREFGYASSTIWRHLTGRCHHDHDEGEDGDSS